MPRNGSGTQSSPGADFPAVAVTLIESTKFNNVVNDINSEITNSIAKDGQTVITANLPMATYRHTGVGNAVARTDYAAAGQVQDGSLNWVDGGGTADAITATYSPAITTLIDGQVCFVRATAANATTTPTFAPNGLTARTIVKRGGVALVAGEISGDSHELALRYDLPNTRWELLNPAVTLTTLGAAALTANTLTGTQTLSGASLIDANASIAAHATTMNPWSLGNYVTATGSAVTFTNMAAAPQAGAEVEIYMNAAHVFTDGAVFEVDGNANYTATIGDRVLIRAKSTTVFTVHPRKADGTAVVGGTINGFSAHKNGTNQTGVVTVTFTKVTFGTEAYDTASKFASDRWTPAAGRIKITAQVVWESSTDGALLISSIYKNGARWREGTVVANGTGPQYAPVNALDDANGTDYYEIYGYQNTGSNKDINGSQLNTYFMGEG